MNAKKIVLVLLVVSAVFVAGCIDGEPEPDEPGVDDGFDDTEPDETGIDAVDGDGFEAETVAEGLEHPWGIAFLQQSDSGVDDRMLVTEREGALVVVHREDGTVETVDGTPDVYAQGQGGMLDVTLHPDYPDEGWVYLTYSASNDDGESATHLGRGELVLDGEGDESGGNSEEGGDDGGGGDGDAPRIDGFEVLHIAEPFVDSNGHFGSRVVFGDDGMVYMTTGDRQFKDFGPDHVSQDTTNELGATLRLTPEGEIPEDNPFVDDEEFEDAIYSYGHRNAQGMTVHPETGELWQSEHGERDGDEINIVKEGGNHGWPLVHYGCEYGTDVPVGELPHERDDTVDPVYYWECGTGGFPPSGATFYDGDAFPDWQGDLFVGNLAGQYLGQFEVNGTDVEETEPLLEDAGWRVRAVEDAPDTGHLYVLVDDSDAPVVRLVPE